jgi:hypothetical protein
VQFSQFVTAFTQPDCRFGNVAIFHSPVAEPQLNLLAVLWQFCRRSFPALLPLLSNSSAALLPQ